MAIITLHFSSLHIVFFFSFSFLVDFSLFFLAVPYNFWNLSSPTRD